jgi:hypothetical protein
MFAGEQVAAPVTRIFYILLIPGPNVIKRLRHNLKMSIISNSICPWEALPV